VLDFRGRLVPVHRLHRCFNIPSDAVHPWDGIVVILEHAGKVFALVVDEMVSKQEVVIIAIARKLDLRGEGFSAGA
jgi:two-component system chemotaxis sensor kinase CheA